MPQQSRPLEAGGFVSLLDPHVKLPFFSHKKILFNFRKRGREGEKEGEKHKCVVASHVPPSRDLAHNPGMCP